MEKTISGLNSKWWYRLIKVIFISLFILSLVIANGVNIYQGIGRIDENKTLIYCNGGDKRILTIKRAGTYFDNSDFIGGFDYKKFYEGYYSEYKIKGIIEACYDTQVDDIFWIQRLHEIRGFKSDPKQFDEQYALEQYKAMTSGYKSDTQKASYLDYSIHLFDIKPVYSYMQFILYILLSNILVFVIFEIIRRIFYYIFLGSIKPKK